MKEQGGHSIAVYKPDTKNAKNYSKELINSGRVNFVAPADYQDGKELDGIIKSIIDKIAADQQLKKWERKSK